MASVNISDLEFVEELSLEQMQEISGGGVPGAIVGGVTGAAGGALGGALGYIGSRTLQGRPLETSGLSDSVLTGFGSGAGAGALGGVVAGALPK